MRTYKYDLSHYRLLSADMGYLVPCACVEVLPGDRFRHSMRALLRVTPLVTPVMHPVEVRLHTWFVPNRIIWSNWEDFITGANDALTVPTHTVDTGSDDRELIDHLGVPWVDGLEINELPIRAYNAIYNEFYRDKDIISERATDELSLARIAWGRDYYTENRPYAQQGDEVSIPFSLGTAPVRGIGFAGTLGTEATQSNVRESGDNDDTYTDGFSLSSATTVDGIKIKSDGQGSSSAHPDIYADLSNIEGGMGVPDVRLSFAQQRIAEIRAFYGEDYPSYLRSLGIRPRDGRLSRPEYLGGGKQWVSFSEVLATGSESGSTNVGDLAGHGIAAIRTRPYRKFFEEGGYVLSLMSVRPKTIYTENLHRHWLRRSKDDFWFKEFEIMGPQAVTTKEVYAAHGNTTDIFGYVDRFREYREQQSYVSGDFRDGDSKNWHYGRVLGTSPTLNSTFIECAPTDRVYAANSVPEVYVNVDHRLIARRLVGRGGIPTRI